MNYCCKMLQYQLEDSKCNIHDKYACPDVVILFNGANLNKVLDWDKYEA